VCSVTLQYQQNPALQAMQTKCIYQSLFAFAIPSDAHTQLNKLPLDALPD